MDPYKKRVFTVLGILLVVAFGINRWAFRELAPLAPETFLAPAGKDDANFEVFQTLLKTEWRDEYSVPLLEISPLISPERRAVLLELMSEKLGVQFDGTKEYWEHYWHNDLPTYEHYQSFKQTLYHQFGKDMGHFFNPGATTVGWDEIFWQQMNPGVIKVLKHNPNVEVDKASFLGEGSVVIGVRMNGESRAYPRPVVTMHRMVVDRIFGKPLYLFVSPLSGAVVAYTLKDGAGEPEWFHSGFACRTDEVFVNPETASLWTPIKGDAITGSEVGVESPFVPIPLVEMEWLTWYTENPKTRVAMPGPAAEYPPDSTYVSYLAEPNTSFPFSWEDERLEKKAPVVVFREPRADEEGKGPMVFLNNFLISNPVYQFSRGGVDWLFLTDQHGRVRAFESEGIEFKRYLRNIAESKDGKSWSVKEQQLVCEDGRTLDPAAVHPMLWMAARSWFPDLELVQ